MLTVAYPFACLLLIPAFLLWRAYPLPSKPCQILRAAILVLSIAILAGLQIHTNDQRGIVFALVDRSASMPREASDRIKQDLKQLAGACPEGSSLGVISFAADAAIESMPGTAPFDDFHAVLSHQEATNLHGALSLALTNIPPDIPSRFIVFSDGHWNGLSPLKDFSEATARQIAVDYRLYSRDTAQDLGFTDIRAPLTVHPGEAIPITCLIQSPKDMTATYSIRRNNGEWSPSAIHLKRGINTITRYDQADQQGTYAYDFSIQSPDEADPIPENNLAQKIVQIQGPKGVLLLTDSPTQNLAALLRSQDIPLTVRTPSPQLLTPAFLSSFTAVILENVPASSLSYSGMELLATMVKNGSIGLMMTGGRSSFGTGGYFKSPLEDVLPVTMEQRKEIRKSTAAIMVALDRSGSMAAAVGNKTKMDLANQGTLEVFRQLMPTDLFGVNAIDSRTHVVLPLAPVSTQKNAYNKILSIESQGGGIFTYTALHDALEQLSRTDALTRHLILFADASDAEEPGQYRDLLAQTSLEGITVSVIGLGTDHDSDAIFLKDVARLGNGICYFTNNPMELPRIFVEDTFAMTRNTFIDTETATAFTHASTLLAQNGAFQQPVQIGGYNLCYPRPDADVYWQTTDEFAAPLATTAQIQLGRTAALLVEADGKYTGEFASHPAAATLILALLHKIAPADNQQKDILISQTIQHGLHRITLELDPERRHDPFQTPPSLSTIAWHQGKASEPQTTAFRWENPDQLAAEYPIGSNAVFLSSILGLSDSARPLAPVIHPVSAEYLPNQTDNPEQNAILSDSDLQTLPQLCAFTNGLERLSPEEIWQDLPHRRAPRDMTPILALGAMLLLLLEIAERRFAFMGSWHFRSPLPASWSLPSWHIKKAPRKEFTPKAPENHQTESAPPPIPAEPPKTDTTSTLSDALKQARTRRP